MMIVTCLHSWSTCWSLCSLGIDLIIITWCYAFSNDIDFLNIIQIGNAWHLKGTKEMPKINAHVNFRKHECRFKVCHFHKLFNHLMGVILGEPHDPHSGQSMCMRPTLMLTRHGGHPQYPNFVVHFRLSRLWCGIVTFQKRMLQFFTYNTNFWFKQTLSESKRYVLCTKLNHCVTLKWVLTHTRKKKSVGGW
jgi:hypothetical protein